MTGASSLLVFNLSSVFAAEMLHDPRGFNDIAWGAALEGREDMALSGRGERVQTYELKTGAPALGQTAVDSMKFFTIDGRFARVVIRYHGKEKHEQVLAYLQTRLGPSDYRPEQMMRGLNQEHAWRGDESQVNLTYEDMSQRGFLFFESRVLAPAFLDNLGE